MKVALVHDYLNEAGGAERVLRVLAEMYPTAPIYTAFIKKGTASEMFRDRELHESAWGWLLKIGRFYSYLRFLLPFIWRSIDLTNYDLVITSTAGGYIARGFRVGSKTKIIAYCHTPPKWLYGYETPTKARSKWWGRLFIWLCGPYLRYFDFTSAQRVDVWMANSQEVAGRIKKFYRRSSIVVYPPVELRVGPRQAVEDVEREYYLLVARMTGAKGIQEAVKAAEAGKFKLKLTGELLSSTLNIRSSRWVEYLGRVSDRELVGLYSKAKGFIALAPDEDFGMTVVEAMQCGTPVIALKSGGYKETVLDGSDQKSKLHVRGKLRTGIFVEDASVESVVEGIKKMEEIRWDHVKIAEWGYSFSRGRFEKEVRRVINARTT